MLERKPNTLYARFKETKVNQVHSNVAFCVSDMMNNVFYSVETEMELLRAERL